MGDERRHQIIAFTSRFNQRSVETADMVAISNLGGSQMGVNTFLEQEVEVSKRRQTLQMIREAGIGFVRQQFPWEDIEGPAKGRFWDEKNRQSSWDKYDNIVRPGQRAGAPADSAAGSAPRNGPTRATPGLTRRPTGSRTTGTSSTAW